MSAFLYPFSFIHKSSLIHDFSNSLDEHWRLAPAYDLCFSFDPTNHWVNKQTLSVNGKRLAIRKEDLMTIAKDNNIKKGSKIIDDINSIVNSWNTYATRAGVRNDLKERIHANLNTL